MCLFHLYVLFGEVSIQVFSPFFSQSVFWFVVSCISPNVHSFIHSFIHKNVEHFKNLRVIIGQGPGLLCIIQILVYVLPKQALLIYFVLFYFLKYILLIMLL